MTGFNPVDTDKILALMAENEKLSAQVAMFQDLVEMRDWLYKNVSQFKVRFTEKSSSFSFAVLVGPLKCEILRLDGMKNRDVKEKVKQTMNGFIERLFS